MKKNIIIIFVFMILASISYSQEFDKPFKFYVFGMDEAGAIFTQAMPFFDSISKGKNIDKARVQYFVDFAYGKEKPEFDMTKCFLKAHFRETKNKEVQKIVMSQFNRLIPKAESNAITYHYKSKVQKLSNDKIQFVYKNSSDEDILFDHPIKFSDFNKKLVIYSPSTNFDGNISFSASPNKEVYMAGGQTAVLKIKVLNESYKSLPKKIKSSRDCIRYDISDYGVMKHNNAEKTVLEFLKNEKDLFIFNLKFYDEDTKKLYTIRYEYTMSSANMNYKIFDQLKKHLLYYSFFSYINN